MGGLTAKTTGEIASFMSPSMTNIKSLKVHFSPKQLGAGDPSPENVREIEGWGGVEAYNDPEYGGNIVWNQCFDLLTLKIGSGTSDVFNVTKLDTGFRVTTNANVSGSGSKVIYFNLKWNRIQNHRYIFLCKIKGDTLNFSSAYFYHANGSSSRPIQNSTGQYVMTETYTGSTATTNTALRLYIYGCTLLEGESFEVTDLMAIDLDIMFGTSIVDANATTATERINWFKSIITNGNYREYNEGEITTVSAVNNEPYTNLSIDWSSDIGTAYGGYIDLISGELVEEYKQVILDSSDTWNTGTNYLYRGGYLPSVGGKNAYVKTLCSHLKNPYDVTTAIAIGKNGNLTVGKNFFDLINIEMTKEAFNQYLETQYNNGTPLQICYLLETPITHQLTPTQLQSFVGQNNFWSNTDYVEIEYELKETEDIQKARKKIILNQPQLKTISNKIVSFNTDMVAPMKSCKIYFNPIQLGSGNPSPTNVRDINGWTGLDSYVNGDKISVDWTSDAGTVYGGYLDLIKSELVVEWAKKIIDGTNNKASNLFQFSEESDFVNVRGLSCVKIADLENTALYNVNDNDFICSHFKWNGYKGRRVSMPDTIYYGSSKREVYWISSTYTTLEEFNQFLINQYNNGTPVTLIYKNGVQTRIPLTSQQLLTLKSTNHIWSETNGQQIDVTYWTRKNLTPTPLTNYLENQTWTESAYISSSGKKTTNTVSASHFLTNQILLEAGTYVLSGFSYYVGTDNTNYRIHAYDSTGTWLRQITFQQIGNLSPVDISFTLDTDTYVNVSIAADFDGVLAKIN